MSVRRVLDECIVLRVARLHRVLTQRQDLALQSLEITGAQLVLLAHMYEKQEVCAKDLCKALRIEKSTMSRNLRRLSKACLIIEGPQRGRRGKQIAITELGKIKVTQALPIWEMTQRRLREQLKPEEMQAVALLA